MFSGIPPVFGVSRLRAAVATPTLALGVLGLAAAVQPARAEVPVVMFGGRQYAVSLGPPAFEAAAFDAVNRRFASRDFIYDACGQAVSAGPEEGPGLAWDAASGLYWQITNDRTVRRWNGGAIVDTVFVIPSIFNVPSSGADTLDAPKGLALDATYVYVVDAGPDPGAVTSNAWFKFTRTGIPVKSSKSTDFVQHLDADPDALVDDIVYSPPSSPVFPGRLLIALEHSGIQVIDVHGNFIAKLRWSSDTVYAGIKPFGFAGLTLDPTTGNLFLVDNDGGRSQVWTRLTSSPARYIVGVSGSIGYLHDPTPGCNRELWRPVWGGANPPGLIFGVAYRPQDGRVYGYDFGSGELWRFDPISGAGELVDATGIFDVWGLAYDTQRDVLYAGQEVGPDIRIHVVNPDTGAETSLPSMVGDYLDDLGFDPVDSRIYGISANTNQLIRIDRDTGVGTAVGPTQPCRGLDYDPSTGKLIGITDSPAKLWSISPSTGAATFLSDLQNDTGWEGLAVIALPQLVATPQETAPVPDSRLRLAPNPFVGSTTIHLELAGPSSVRVVVFDAAGRLVRRVYDGVLGGSQTLTWDGHDAEGRVLPSGMYWIRANAAGWESTGRVLLVR